MPLDRPPVSPVLVTWWETAPSVLSYQLTVQKSRFVCVECVLSAAQRRVN